MTSEGSRGRTRPAAAFGDGFAYVRTVAWSFFGIRRAARAADEIGRLRPVPLIIAGVLLAAVFVGVLVSLAHLAVAGLGA